MFPTATARVVANMEEWMREGGREHEQAIDRAAREDRRRRRAAEMIVAVRSSFSLRPTDRPTDRRGKSAACGAAAAAAAAMVAALPGTPHTLPSFLPSFPPSIRPPPLLPFDQQPEKLLNSTTNEGNREEEE